MNKKGFAPVLILIVVGLLLVVGVYFGLSRFNEFAEKFAPKVSKVTSSPAPSSSGLTKQQRYEQNKEKIKEQLHLSEQEFQTLKRFSGD